MIPVSVGGPSGVLALEPAGDLMFAVEGEYGVVAFHAGLLPLDNIFAVLDGRDCGGVGRRASYAQLLHFLHKRSLGVTRGCEGEALGGGDVIESQCIAGGHAGEGGVAVGGLVLVVASFQVDAEETVKLDHLARSGEVLVAVADIDLGGGLLELGVGHLRCYGAEAYEAVQLLFLSGPVDGLLVHVGGADGLVSLLRTLARGVVLAYLDVFLAHLLLDQSRDG